MAAALHLHFFSVILWVWGGDALPLLWLQCVAAVPHFLLIQVFFLVLDMAARPIPGASPQLPSACGNVSELDPEAGLGKGSPWGLCLHLACCKQFHRVMSMAK